MTVTSLTSIEASALSVQTLGLDPELVGLGSTEALTASLLRAASFMCPTSPSRLINAVRQVVQPLVPVEEVNRESIADLLDLLVAAGDLLELEHELDGRSVRLLYLGPPSFIEREAGMYLLFGVRPYGAALIAEELQSEVEWEGHTRTIQFDPATAKATLTMAGLQEIERHRWVASPSAESAAELIARIGSRLDVAGRGGEIEGLRIMDPTSPVRFYKGRWRDSVPSDNGDFVARRPQAYGADLWSAVRLEDGTATKIIHFPVDNPVVPARDEAWRLQMAIDAERGRPQCYSAEPTVTGDAMVVRFFSPIPGFAERYLQLVGLPLAETPNALFAFRMPLGAMLDLTQLLTDLLWMEPAPKESN